jgi:hypothetical protein
MLRRTSKIHGIGAREGLEETDPFANWTRESGPFFEPC